MHGSIKYIKGVSMRTIFGKKETIFDKLADAVAECAIDDKEIIKEFHLEEDEFKEYIRVMSGLGAYIGPSDKKYYFQGIEVKKVPRYDLFYDEEYWIEHDFSLDDKLDAPGIDVYHTGIFMVYHGQAYRKVSNLAGDPAPVKNVSKSDFCFKTESEGIPIPTMPDKKLIARLQDKFNWGVLTSNETTDLIKHQRKHIRNLEAKVRNNYVNCDHSFSLGA
jgi:hypothetical protein